MTCEEAREHVELSFGGDELVDGLPEHLAACESCRRFHDELNGLTGQLGSDSDFHFNVEDAVDAVTAQISGRESRPVVNLSWMRYLTRVAAGVVLVAASYVSYQVGSHDLNGTTDPVSVGYVAEVDSWLSDTTLTLDDETVDILIEDYARRSVYGAGEALLDDLTDDELEYLMENLDVGEIL
ncbi:MAG: hypothetical protein KKA42_15175 [candidate division Zixibacteria bacterium]|nr:hypothetical protein [candidate division Zixibacteria bacterium]